MIKKILYTLLIGGFVLSGSLQSLVVSLALASSGNDDTCSGNHTPEPVIKVMNNQSTVFELGETARLSGFESSDADDDDLWLLWAVNDLGIEHVGESFEFTPEKAGSYIVTLLAGDRCDYKVVWVALTFTDPNSDLCAANHKPEMSDVVPVNPTIAPGETVTLSGEGVSDPDGDDLWYFWEIHRLGIKHEGQNLNFTAPQEEGTYTATLVVADRCDYVVKYTHVIVEGPLQCDLNQTPTPVISPQNPTVRLGDSITFNAYDTTEPDGDILWYFWAINELGLDSSERPGRTFYFKPTTTGEFILTLTTGDQCSYDTVWTKVFVEEGEPMPDLRITAAQTGRLDSQGRFINQTPTEDDLPGVKLTFKNIGNGESGEWGFAANDPETIGTYKSENNFPSLGPNETYNYVFGLKQQLPAGNYAIVFTVDPDNLVAETHEENNNYRKPFEVLPGQQPEEKPDLKFSRISYSIEELELLSGEVIKVAEITYCIENSGNETVPENSFYVKLFDKEPNGWVAEWHYTYGEIAPGQERCTSTATSNLKKGENTIGAEVDSRNQIEETSEENNSEEFVLVWPGV